VQAQQSKTSLLALVPEIIRQAQETAQGIRDAREKAFALGFITVTQARLGDIDGAKQTADRIIETDATRRFKADALIAVGEAQAQSGDREGARRNFSDVKQRMAGISAFDKALLLADLGVAQAKAGELEDAKQTATDVVGSDPGPVSRLSNIRILEAIAQSQFQSGDVAGANQTIEGFKFSSDRMIIWRWMARAQIESGDLKGARLTLVRLKQMEAVMSDVFASSPNYITSDDISSLVEIAELEVKAGDVASGRQILSSAKRTAGRMSKPEDKASGLRIVAEAQALTGDLAGAKQTAAGINDSNEKKLTLVAVAAATAKAPHSDKNSARQILRSVKAAAGIGLASKKLEILCDIAITQARIGDVNDALQTESGMSASNEKTMALHAIVEAQLLAGDKESAKRTLIREKQVLERMRGPVVNADYKVAVLTDIAEGQVQAGDIVAAKQTAAGVSSAPGKTVVLATIARVLAESNAKK